jgi:hypothetical protein
VWEFLGEVLERHGLASVISVAVIGAFGFAIRTLWLKNAELQCALVRGAAEQAQAVHVIRADCERAVVHCRKQLDALHERRNTETREILRENLVHIAETRAAVDRITEAVQELVSLQEEDT